MARRVNASTVRALVEQALKEDGATRLIGVAATPWWEGPETIDAHDGVVVEVRPCVSVLAVREVLTEVLGDPQRRALILTEVEDGALGTEVLARLWRHRLYSPNQWEALKGLFRATDMDPALADVRWLVDLLVDVAPAGGFAPPKSGLLDLDTAWQTYIRYGLNIDSGRPRLADLLLWGEKDESRALLSQLVQEHIGDVADRLGGAHTDAVRHVLRLVGEGRGADLVPLGLVCDVLWGQRAGEGEGLTTARVRFEGTLGERGLSREDAGAWGEAAVSLVRRAHGLSGDEDTGRPRWANRAEAILESDLDALALAVNSDVLPRGFEQRLEAAGTALLGLLEERTDETARSAGEAVRSLGQHIRQDGAREQERVDRVRMAERIARRWGRGEPTRGTKDLAGAAQSFATDGAWLDRARETLGQGESGQALPRVYATMIERLDRERAERDLHFAKLLSGWSALKAGERAPLLPIERVLDAIVVPVAEQQRVLLIVLDGWSLPISLRLLEDLREPGWERLGPAESEHPVVVAALPSVTTASRASLLCGRLAVGGQDVERAGWEEHQGLREVSHRTPARLFHRADLGTTDGRIAGDVRNAILDADVQVVGVVVNAVDEHLDRGGQLRLAAGLDGLRPVGPLLDSAMEAGRVVVLVSDHGHVVQAGPRVTRPEGGGERWRPEPPPAADGEVHIRGPRVLMGKGSVVLPATEELRYISVQKHGYHGGATPQEVLCPLAVLAPPGKAVAGWSALPSLEPWWWREEGRLVSAPAPTVTTRPADEQRPAVDAKGQGQLFEQGRAEPQEPAQPDRPAWLRGLLRSPILAAQRAAAGRQNLPDDDVAELLLVLDRAGGVSRVNILAQHLGIPLSRVQTKASVLRRLLNVDGYTVVEVEGDGTIRFKRDLLISQFGLDG